MSVLVGPRFRFNKNRVTFYETSEGIAPDTSTLWYNYDSQPIDEVILPESGFQDTCWVLGNDISRYYPTCCVTCADFNNSGAIEIDDLKFFINLMGTKSTTIKSTLVGDFNGDGIVDTKDLVIMLKCINKISFI